MTDNYKKKMCKVINRQIWMILLIVLSVLLCFRYADSQLIERIVAIVNSEVILHSELEDAVSKVRGTGGDVTREQVLDELIDRLLILQQAEKFGLRERKYYRNDEKDDEIINLYIEKRIKSVIHVSFDEIEDYFQAHKDEFDNRDIYAAWDQIEQVLRGEKVLKNMQKHLSKLRKRAYIRIQMSDDKYQN